MHVDEFIDGHFNEEKYARWCFLLFRLPAVLQADFREFTKKYKLFCTYNAVRFRVTGASRLGDIWLTSDFNQDTGYEHRVDLSECSEWGDKP